jgi:arylsulfatase A
MADDMGYECLGANGSTSYKTPVLDGLASKGIRFTNCISQPLCTPSRVKIMTGKYNYRNYDYFGHLNTQEYTFGNVMQDAGYQTCVAGKWQLNGLKYVDEIEDWNDAEKPNKFGFDEYCLWQLNDNARKGGRYANPLIRQNGTLLERDKNSYGPDIFSDYILNFIERKKDVPFFVYYPMVLVHDPFVPTPDSKTWQEPSKRRKNDKAYFKDMVAYTDKIVGSIVNKLESLDFADITIIIFTGDNGTHTSIYTKTQNGIVKGGKGTTANAGTHVPLVVSWSEYLKQGKTYDGLIEFRDFFATLADMANNNAKSDGISFYPLLKGEAYTPRETAFVHYDPRWGERVNKNKNQFVRTVDYKLYRDGRFFNVKKDVLEAIPIQENTMTPEESKIKKHLEAQLQKHPILKLD